MKLLAILLILLLASLQYRAWFSDDGYFAAKALAAQLEQQQQRAEALAQRNRILAAEVVALKKGLAPVEARARADLGMIREGETFFIVDEQAPGGAAESSERSSGLDQ